MPLNGMGSITGTWKLCTLTVIESSDWTVGSCGRYTDASSACARCLIVSPWATRGRSTLAGVHVTDHQLVIEGGHGDPDAVFVQLTAMASMTRL